MKTLKIGKALAALGADGFKEAVAIGREFLARAGEAPAKRKYTRRKKTGAKPGPKPGSRRKKADPEVEEVTE